MAWKNVSAVILPKARNSKQQTIPSPTGGGLGWGHTIFYKTNPAPLRAEEPYTARGKKFWPFLNTKEDPYFSNLAASRDTADAQWVSHIW
jgi:hypothetical protein